MDVTFQTLYRFCAEGNVIVNIRPLRRVFKSAKQRETNLTFGVTLEVKEVGCYWLAIFYLLLSLCLIAMLASSKKNKKQIWNHPGHLNSRSVLSVIVGYCHFNFFLTLHGQSESTCNYQRWPNRFLI